MNDENTSRQHPARSVWIIVPAFNEAVRLPTTLAALAAQQHDPLDALTVVVVDNASTDATSDVAHAFARDAPFPVVVLHEPEPGVGCAVDTGFRHAIEHGATHLLRTDADCLPRRDWVTQALAAFDAGGELVCGKIIARRDESGIAMRAAFRGMVHAAALFGRLRPKNRGVGEHGLAYRVPYAMHAGNNMAITAELYLRCSGMPRHGSPTDRRFLNRVREHTDRIVQAPAMISENSVRRLRAYGVIGTARWYLDQGAGDRAKDPR